MRAHPAKVPHLQLPRQGYWPLALEDVFPMTCFPHRIWMITDVKNYACVHFLWNHFSKSCAYDFWDLELAVEVRQCQLRSGVSGWGAAVSTDLWSSWLRTRRRRGWRGRGEEEAWKSVIKSRDLHLAGGELLIGFSKDLTGTLLKGSSSLNQHVCIHDFFISCEWNHFICGTNPHSLNMKMTHFGSLNSPQFVCWNLVGSIPSISLNNLLVQFISIHLESSGC